MKLITDNSYDIYILMTSRPVFKLYHYIIQINEQAKLTWNLLVSMDVIRPKLEVETSRL